MKEALLEDMESTEEFFRFFGLEYDESLVMVNRFSILFAFGERKRGVDAMPALSEEERFLKYREALSLSYIETIEGKGKPLIKKASCGGCTGCPSASFDSFKPVDLGGKDGGL